MSNIKEVNNKPSQTLSLQVWDKAVTRKVVAEMIKKNELGQFRYTKFELELFGWVKFSATNDIFK